MCWRSVHMTFEFEDPARDAYRVSKPALCTFPRCKSYLRSCTPALDRQPTPLLCPGLQMPPPLFTPSHCKPAPAGFCFRSCLQIAELRPSSVFPLQPAARAASEADEQQRADRLPHQHCLPTPLALKPPTLQLSIASLASFSESTAGSQTASCTLPLQTSPSRLLLPKLPANSQAAPQLCVSFAASSWSSPWGHMQGQAAEPNNLHANTACVLSL